MAIDEQVMQRLQGKPDWMQEGWEVKKQIEVWIRSAAEVPLTDVEESEQQKRALEEELGRKRQELEGDTQKESLEYYRKEAERLRKRVAAIQAFEKGAVPTVLDELWDSLKTLAAAAKLYQWEANTEKTSAIKELGDGVAALHRGKAMVQLGESAEEAFKAAFPKYNETSYSGTAKEKEAHKALQLRWYKVELQEARVAMLKAQYAEALEGSAEKAKLEYALREAEQLQEDLVRAAKNSQDLFPQHEFLIGGHLVEYCKAKSVNTSEVDQLMGNEDIKKLLAVLSEIKADPELIKDKIRAYQKEDGSINRLTSAQNLNNQFHQLYKAIREGITTNFETALQERGMQVVKEKDDGNCWYHAVARQIPDDSPIFEGIDVNLEKHMKVRLACCRLIEANPDKFRDFLVGESIEQYVGKMQQGGKWADEPEMVALSLLGYQIKVYDVTGDGRNIKPRVYSVSEGVKKRGEVSICRYNANHYNTVAPLQQKVRARKGLRGINLLNFTVLKSSKLKGGFPKLFPSKTKKRNSISMR